MQLPLFFHGLTGPTPLRPALQAAIVAAAAVAGYVTFLPLTQTSGPASLTVAGAEQPQWAGIIEQPGMDAQQPSARVTSASYVVPEAGSLDNASKKNGLAIAVIPKIPGKPVLPPRRPASPDDAAKATAAPAASLAPPAAGALIPPAPIPVAVAASEAPAKPAARNMFSPVTDHLPTTGTLLKPFHVVGDAFHNLIKF
jgi:hypothetical protein